MAGAGNGSFLQPGNARQATRERINLDLGTLDRDAMESFTAKGRTVGHLLRPGPSAPRRDSLLPGFGMGAPRKEDTEEDIVKHALRILFPTIAILIVLFEWSFSVRANGGLAASFSPG